jgi:hypothetical protein
METWTTFDIEKILKIKRNRLKEWIDRGFIKPTYQEETGTGKKSLFNRWGLYCIKTFELLLDNGVSRDQAGKWLQYLYRFDPEDKNSPEDPLWRKSEKPPTFLILKKDIKDELYQCSLNWGSGFQLKKDADKVCFIFNFEMIKNEVDKAIE